MEYGESEERHTASRGESATNNTNASNGTGSANDRHGYEVANIPQALQNISQWGVWLPEWKNGKLGRVPYNARTGQHLSTSDPATWSPFAVALDAYLRGTRGQWGGLSFVITATGGLVGLDLDECVDDAGNLSTEAQTIVDLFNSYCEFSPSRQGIRGFAAGTLPAGRRKKGDLEIYDTKVLTITGWHLDGTPTAVAERTSAISSIHARFFGKKKPASSTNGKAPAVEEDEPLDDEEVLALMLGAKNGARLHALLDGDLAGFASTSEADLAVCNYLAFYCGRNAHEQIDRIFREHFPFFRPLKWDKRHFGNGDTYGEGTIKKALEERTEFYTRPLLWRVTARVQQTVQTRQQEQQHQMHEVFIRARQQQQSRTHGRNS